MNDDVSDFPRASQQDGTYPRPQLVRPEWLDLSGTWDFAFDDDDRGLGEHWAGASAPFNRVIEVPFPPESPASGVGDTSFRPIVWYRREIDAAQLETAGSAPGRRVILHFGAVDYHATVWIDGQLVGTHEGGGTPFSFDVTDRLVAPGPWVVVVRAYDDPFDLSQPRGKQDWQRHPHSVFYDRTTGIWQPVWIETVPTVHVSHLEWRTPSAAEARLSLDITGRRGGEAVVSVDIAFQGTRIGSIRVVVAPNQARLALTIPLSVNQMDSGYRHWSPESPQLHDARITLASDGGNDTVTSYFGVRTIGLEGGNFLLNGRPCFLRSVLEQGFWPESHLAAPSARALYDEVRLTKQLGFNAVRVHQKAEDPRFLFWADRLGLLVWGEAANAMEFSAASVQRTLSEWVGIVRRDASHPSIVTWVPVNESWGVPGIAHDPAQRALALALYQVTKALDPTRPVLTNDGWEHLGSDLWTIHDYRDARSLAASYQDEASLRESVAGTGWLGHRILLAPDEDRKPVVVSEFGGIFIRSDVEGVDYRTVDSEEEFEVVVRGLFESLRRSPTLAGFCYTQLTDTQQETNGLLTASRQPKLPVETLHSIITGQSASQQVVRGDEDEGQNALLTDRFAAL